jgi:hypothetical protein
MPPHLQDSALAQSCLRRPVVVRQVEMRDAQVERPPDDRPLRIEPPFVPEVLPEPERDFRQHDPAAPAAAVSDMLVTVSGGEVSHAASLAPHRRRYVHPWPVAPLGWHY